VGQYWVRRQFSRATISRAARTNVCLPRSMVLPITVRFFPLLLSFPIFLSLSLPRPSMLLDIFLLLSYLVYCFIFHFFFRLFVRRFLFIYMCCSSLTYIPIVHRINFTLSCISLVGNGAFVWGPNSWNSVFFLFRKKSATYCYAPAC
jgi:hypothetical protein